MRGRQTKAGLALVEVLVVLALLGLITTMLAGSLRFGVRLWERAEQRSNNEILVFANYIESNLSAAQVTQDGRYLFAGEPERLSFVTQRSLKEDPRQIVLSVEEGRLGIVETRLSDGITRQLDLMEGVTNWRLRYFGRTSFAAPVSWQEAWRTQKLLPQLVEITFEKEGQPQLLQVKLDFAN